MKDIFKQALEQYKNEESKYDPILDKYKELVKIIDENFFIKEVETNKKYFFSKRTTSITYIPALHHSVIRKFKLNNQEFLEIQIGQQYFFNNYIMFIQDNNVYFIDRVVKNIVEDVDKNDIVSFERCNNTEFRRYFLLSNKITIVQFFVLLIRKYYDNLKNENT